MKRHHSRRGMPAGQATSAVRPTGAAEFVQTTTGRPVMVAGVVRTGAKPVVQIDLRPGGGCRKHFLKAARKRGVELTALDPWGRSWECVGTPEALLFLCGMYCAALAQRMLNVGAPRGGPGSGPEKGRPSRGRPKGEARWAGARRPEGAEYEVYRKVDCWERYPAHHPAPMHVGPGFVASLAGKGRVHND